VESYFESGTLALDSEALDSEQLRANNFDSAW